ncbi:Eukaryotic initiation factor 4F subunit p150 [Nakaseomyces glabratus]|nr:Eukaryotic initiation factor 4F subunit p150 [Nakaseomyces glabratus]KTB24827.1 Eukaryotic initiation factor 4F subunit p150 [Nakaseomyces glabratus]
MSEDSAEQVRKTFIEQVRMRKAALEQAKLAKQKAEEDAKRAAEEEEKKKQEAAKAEVRAAEEAKAAEAKAQAEAEAAAQKEAHAEADVDAIEADVEEKVDDSESNAEMEVDAKEEAAPEEKTEEAVVAPENSISVFLENVHKAEGIEDPYTMEYPAGLEKPDPRYKKETMKYTYGPTFLLQFKTKINFQVDEQFKASVLSKIVIPPSSGNRRNNSTRSLRDPALLPNSSRNGSRRSTRNSKRSSRRGDRDRDSRRGARDSFRKGDENSEKQDQKPPAEPVAPLVPSANRWVPKSRLKKATTEDGEPTVRYAPDGKTVLLEKEDVERKMKSLLNKLTLEKFEPISTEIIEIANQSQWEKNGETLQIVIEQIFLKACDEPHWSTMYAQLCGKLVKDLNEDIADENNEGKSGPKLVLLYLVARCHTEFSKGWSDKLPTNEDDSPMEPEMMSDEYYQAVAAKRRGLGLVRFIGFLYNLHLLTVKMMFECFRRLMKDLTGSPSNEVLESVVELLNTVGQQFETDSFAIGENVLLGSDLLDTLFELIQNVIDAGKISSRIKFKLIDLKELREEKNWNNDKNDQGPKTIKQIHEEDEKARQLKAMNSSNMGSRNNSRRSGGRDRDFPSRQGSNRDRGLRNSKREFSSRSSTNISKDSFITTRSASGRYTNAQTARNPLQKEEAPIKHSASTNMFSALMNDDEE